MAIISRKCDAGKCEDCPRFGAGWVCEHECHPETDSEDE